MRNILHSSVICIALLALIPLVSRADAPSAPAPDAAQKLFDTGQFADALKTARASLAITGTAGAAYDRHALYMLAAESCLHLKQSLPALDLLKTAQKEATKNDQTSDAQLALAFATLIQNSPNNTYTAKDGDTTTKYDILDTTVRHQCYEALFTDQKNRCEAKIHAAQQATSLTPILDVTKMYTVTRALELAASGDTKRSDALAREAQQWAGNLINTTENDFDARITRIQIDSNVNALGRIRPRLSAGISSGDIATLHGIVADCQKIPDAVKTFAAAFEMPNAMSHQIARAADLVDRVNKTLQENVQAGNGRS